MILVSSFVLDQACRTVVDYDQTKIGIFITNHSGYKLYEIRMMLDACHWHVHTLDILMFCHTPT